ncbi:MAG: 4-demethylwyosine synthase TYW1 [Thermoplasmata archaeon]|nr:MAG: 4-demethylwyosine synthase TYW1 [Thermoplasmata archaeon]
MEENIRRLFERQGYKVVGEHSAVKLCHWLREAIVGGESCYKSQFYGIKTHRCLQMSPAATVCTQECLFCWRYQGYMGDVKKWDEPEYILEGAIEAQRKLLSGYKGYEKTVIELWKEANEPKHVAISLTGEPTLYPYLGDFIELCHKRGMTTFLVTNGTRPDVLEKLDPLPTQLYVTIAAPDEYVYKKLQRPKIKDGWGRIMKTIDLLPSLDTRKVIRHTLVRHWNMKDVDTYAKIDERSEADFIEPKAYMFVGYSRERLSIDNMPSHKEILNFAHQLSSLLGYDIIGENKRSRVALLSRGSKSPLISINYTKHPQYQPSSV